MKRILLLLALLVVGLSAQDAEKTNYKTGIEGTWGIGDGSDKGTAYMEEYLFSDKLASDRKVIYIKDTTAITFTHNARNVARVTGSYYSLIGVDGVDGIPASGDEGKIRYRVDGDLNWGLSWTDGQGGTPYPLYTAPLTFATLTYPSGAGGGLSVAGRTGNNGVAVTSKTGHFNYGVADTFTDEWHTITVADDDYYLTSTDTEWRASDGRVFQFVVNPKTPAMTVRATGNGQFYTTPPKIYFIPKIFDQTTYFNAGTGTVTFELRNLYGTNISYRINGGSTVAVGAATVTLDQSNFSTGSNTLEYWYDSTPSVKRTRIVVKNPGFPSAGEVHGLLQTGNPTNYAAMLTRKGVAPYKYHWDRLYSRTTALTTWDQNASQGLRYVPDAAATYSMVALVSGVSYVPSGKTKTFAAYAKEMLMQNARTIDNVGFEMHHPQNTLPTRELTYRGYYDVGTVFNQAYAYDTLINIYRSDQAAGGITAIEDYYLRDCLANDVVECLMYSNGLQSPFTVLDTGGMWDTSRKCGALIEMFAMPAYSTPYYGTSGLDGNTTVYPWTPFKDTPLTWKQVFLDDDQPMTGYPNLAQRLGIENYNCAPDGNFTDRTGYVVNMGNVFVNVANTLKFQYPSKSFPFMEHFFLRATEGTLIGLSNNSGPIRAMFLSMFNGFFPTIADIGIPFVQSLPSTDPYSDDQVINGTMPTSMIFYDVNYSASGDTTPPTITVNTPSGNITVTSTPYTLSAGTATDNTGVAAVEWSTDKGYSGTATGTSTWTVASIPLSSGANVVTYRSRDAAGNYSTAVTRTITLTPAGDTTPPTITVSVPSGSVTVTSTPYAASGTATDNTAVTSVRIENATSGLTYTATGTSSWSYDIPLVYGANTVNFTALDAAGNVSSVTTRTITYNPPSSGSTETHTNPRNRLGF